MKNFLIFCTILCITFFSCRQDRKEELHEIKASVESAERIVNRYDNNVQSAIESKNFDYIKIVSRTAMDSLSSLSVKIINTPIPPSHEKAREYAISYITALQNVIVAEEAYSALSDALTDQEAEDMDHKLLLASQKAREEQVKYSNILISFSDE